MKQIIVNGKLLNLSETKSEETDNSLEKIPQPKRASSKPAQITKGIFGLVYKQKHIEWLSYERMKYCLNCPASKKLDSGQLVCSSSEKVKVKDEEREVFGCGCVLEIKTRSPKASCPALKWKAVDEIELKNKFQ
jgi:hypothetical protein